MEVRCLVPEDRGAYLAHFSQREYPAWFSRYQALAQPVFDRLDTPEEAEAAAAALVEYCGTLLRPLRRSSTLEELKSLFALYTVPAAAAHGGQGAAAFAGKLAEHWRRSYPRQPFLQGTYEELMQGFAEKRFLGLDAKWFGLKK